MIKCLNVQNFKILLYQETTARKMTLSVAAAAETEAPDLHDLVTKTDPDGFVWDHQFTVSNSNKPNQIKDKYRRTTKYLYLKVIHPPSSHFEREIISF